MQSFAGTRPYPTGYRELCKIVGPVISRRPASLKGDIVYRLYLVSEVGVNAFGGTKRSQKNALNQ
jgi:hypothetical protein